MSEEIVDILQKLELLGSEKEGVDLEGEDIIQGMKGCENSVIGKVFGEKAANYNRIKSFVNNVWNYPKGLTVVELGVNLFQSRFGEKEAMEREDPIALKVSYSSSRNGKKG